MLLVFTYETERITYGKRQPAFAISARPGTNLVKRYVISQKLRGCVACIDLFALEGDWFSPKPGTSPKLALTSLTGIYVNPTHCRLDATNRSWSFVQKSGSQSSLRVVISSLQEHRRAAPVYNLALFLGRRGHLWNASPSYSCQLRPR